jgi:hypothetical protein
MTSPDRQPAGTTFEWLRCEQPIDDLLVGTSDGGLIFCQVKRTALSSAADSELFGIIKRFVDQYRSRSLSHSATWFQLAKLGLTK